MDDSLGDMFKLVGSNYSIWKYRMEDLLYCKDLYLPMYGNIAKPEDMSQMNWDIMHRKTCAFIRSFIDQSLYHNFQNENKAGVLWKKIETMFEIKTAYNKASIFRKILRLRYEDGTSMEEHLNIFQDLMNQTITMEISLADEIMALMLLGTLPDSWDTLVMTLSNSTPDTKLSLEMVKNSLLFEEAGRNGQNRLDSSLETNALVRETDKDKSKSKKNFSCHYCDGPNHNERNCKMKKRDLEEGTVENKDDKDIASTEVGDVVIFTTDARVLSTRQPADWIIATRAPFHVTPYRDLFTSYSSGSYGKVMANEGMLDIVGIGNIALGTNIGCRILLRDVRHVPDIGRNIISVSKLCNDGCNSSFYGEKCDFIRGSLIVAECKMLNSLYYFQAEEINAASENFSIELWHKRLGHMSQKGLNILSKRQLIPEMTGLSLPTCVDCMTDKQHKDASESLSLGGSSNRLDLVHTDLFNMKEKTIGGKQYFLTFIDDFSRKIWCFSLKSKEQVFEVFKDFQAKVELETGRKLKCICADNGIEYQGRFEKHCRDQGIRLEKSVPSAPRQNVVAVRVNEMIREQIKFMLSHSKLPISFWGEAMNTAVYLINLSPSVALDGDVPERVWTGIGVSYKHLRVFGCRACVHIPNDERPKLDGKTKLYIFMGYGNEELSYRLLDPVNMKVIRSRDVIFLEDETGISVW